MSENPNASSIPVSSRSGFGDVEILKVDSQRLNIARESTFNFQNMVAVPSVGILADLTFWVTGSALYFRSLKILLMFELPYQFFLTVIGIPFLVLLIVFILSWSKGKFLVHWLYRLFIIVVGFYFAL